MLLYRGRQLAKTPQGEPAHDGALTAAPTHVFAPSIRSAVVGSCHIFTNINIYIIYLNIYLFFFILGGREEGDLPVTNQLNNFYFKVVTLEPKWL